MRIDGCRLHYLEAGPVEGRALGTVVMLHGASSNLVESMLSLGNALSAGYRVVAVDRPGHGWSERSEGVGAEDPAHQAGVIAEALRRLKVRNAVIVGHSWAGLIAPHFGLDHRDVAGALLIIAGVTHPWPGGYAGWYDRLTASWAGRLFMRTLAVPINLMLREAAARKTFAPQPVPPGFPEKAFIPLAFRPGAYQANARDFAVMHEAVHRQSQRYGAIAMPVVVFAGESDEIVWTDLHSRSLGRDVPGAELVLLPGVGHMPHYARPDLALAAVEGLARRIAPAGAPVEEG